MKQRNAGVVLLSLLVLLLGWSATAGAAVPAITTTYAKQMHCKWPEESSFAIGGPNSGVQCVVKNSVGRQEFYVLKYRNIARATDAWRDWIGRDGYIVRRAHVFVISQGNNGRHGDWGYSLKWAKYAANHMGGRIIHGY